MTELSIEQWPLERLIPYANNPRKNEHAVGQMASVMREYGFRVPLLARTSGELIDGHLRLKAAMTLGYETVPVIIANDLSSDQARIFLRSSASQQCWR